MTTKAIRKRLEYLRGELRAERISYGELADLQSLAEHIDPSDVELLEAAGVPEIHWTVVDEENAATHDGKPEIGEQVRVLGRFATQAEAEEFVANQPDKAKLHRGGFGIDSPEE